MAISNKQLINSIFYPRKSFKDKDTKDHLVVVDQKINVGVRFFLNDKAYPTILFFHGNAELGQEYDDIAEYFNKYAMNLVVSDYRGYGLSNGNPSKDNLHLDSLKVFEYFNTFLNDNQYLGKKVVMGRSLGSASTAHIIENKYASIDGCIIESGFATEHPLLHLMNINPDSIGFTLEDGFENLRKFRNYKKNYTTLFLQDTNKISYFKYLC